MFFVHLQWQPVIYLLPQVNSCYVFLNHPWWLYADLCLQFIASRRNRLFIWLLAYSKDLDALLFLDSGLWPTKSSFTACVASCNHAWCLVVIKIKWWHHRFAVVAILIRISHTFFIYCVSAYDFHVPHVLASCW